MRESKYKIRTFDVFLKISKFRRFLEDQMDPKSAVGGPKPISRTGRDSAKNIDYRPTPKKRDLMGALHHDFSNDLTGNNSWAAAAFFLEGLCWNQTGPCKIGERPEALAFHWIGPQRDGRWSRHLAASSGMLRVAQRPIPRSPTNPRDPASNLLLSWSD